MFTFLFVVFTCILKILTITFVIALVAVAKIALIILSALFLVGICFKLLLRKHLKVKIIVQDKEVDMVFPDKDALGNWLIEHIGTYTGWRYAT